MVNKENEPIVALNDLWLVLKSQAGSVEILRGVNLNVRYGESVSISGPSGAGKTSLMMIIGGMEKATRGQAVVAGVRINDSTEDELARFRRQHVGIVFQSFHLIPTMTALENVAIPLELSGDKDAFDRARSELAEVGLLSRLGHYPSQLSGGEQQRVAIARALIAQPDLILADEPTGNLDMTNSERIMDLLIQRCADKNATLLLITHQRELAQRCTRHVEISDGRIIANTDG
ncbi:MAG: ABC transporter ATP-binding protein [Acidiferrobacterales bacterium]|nr:ABC transporter ATP-binding protein [Acidiferrobacterales bacterium]